MAQIWCNFANPPGITPEIGGRSLTEIEIWVTARREKAYQHFIYFPRDLAHENAEIDRVPGPVPVSLDRLQQNLSQDGIDVDLAEAFFTANPDDTVLSSEITHENHILLAYLDGKSHVHWILHYQNDPQAEDNNPVIPALPIFNSDPDFSTARCPDSDVTPIVRIPWGERNINYFRYNLYALSADKVLSYERLLTNLGNDLPNQNLDLAAMESIAKLRVRNPHMSHKDKRQYHNSTNIRIFENRWLKKKIYDYDLQTLRMSIKEIAF